VTWPTNWIEQAVYYQRLVAELAQLQAQAQTVTVPSFTRPTQAMWEDAYSQQVGQIKPIQPGTRLFWFDLKNGTPKRFATVYAPDGITIDPLVRRFVSDDQPRSCFRLLATRQTFDNSQFNSVNSPIRHKEFSLLLGLDTSIQKNLVALMIRFRMQSPIWISLTGDWRGSAEFDAVWGSPFTAAYMYVERAAAAVANTGLQTSIGFDGYMPETPASMAVTATETFTGYNLIFTPAAPSVNGEYQPLSAGVMYTGLIAAQTAQATPMRFSLAAGAKYDATGLKELYFGTRDQFGIMTDHADVYGIFADNPGIIEVFDDSL
jgi:hypothetical protein